MSRPWTAISYNWSVGKTSRIVFHGSFSPAMAKEEFESKYPKEDLVALVPGQHENTSTYPLNNFKGSFEEDA